MKGFKKFLAVSCAVVAVFGLATIANAKAPKTPKTITVQLFKEKESSGNRSWWVDKATSLLPIRNLKWNAKVSELSASNSKACLEKREVGAYYLNIKAAKTVKPGDQTKVAFLIRQEGEYYVKKVTIKFVKAASPMNLVKLSGLDCMNHAVEFNFAARYAGVRTLDWTRPAGVDLVKLEAAVAADQDALKIYGALKNKGNKEVRLYSGNMYEISKFSYIKFTYSTPLAKTPAYIQNYFKVENDAFAGTKRFPVAKYCVLNIK